MGLFQTYYQETLLSNYSTCSRWTGGVFFGRVIDTYGTHHVAIPCSIACVIFIILLSLCTTYSQIFLAQGVGFGLAASGLFSCGVVSVGQWFHKRKAFALGLVLMGSSTGISYHLFSFVDSGYLSMVYRRCSSPNLSPDSNQGNRVACSCSLLRSYHSSSEFAGMPAHERPSTEEEMGSESALLRLCIIQITRLQRLFSRDLFRNVSHIYHSISCHINISNNH
jgi:hypothetical protein